MLVNAFFKSISYLLQTPKILPPLKVYFSCHTLPYFSHIQLYPFEQSIFQMYSGQFSFVVLFLVLLLVKIVLAFLPNLLAISLVVKPPSNSFSIAPLSASLRCLNLLLFVVLLSQAIASNLLCMVLTFQLISYTV